jgi:predicted transcriptional regulator
MRAIAAGEQEFISAVKDGLADARAGRVLEHEQIVRHFERRFKKTPRQDCPKSNIRRPEGGASRRRK